MEPGRIRVVQGGEMAVVAVVLAACGGQDPEQEVREIAEQYLRAIAEGDLRPPARPMSSHEHALARERHGSCEASLDGSTAEVIGGMRPGEIEVRGDAARIEILDDELGSIGLRFEGEWNLATSAEYRRAATPEP